MSVVEDKPQIYKGLAGVVVDTTAISKVVPETNSLTYRGYPVQDLATHCSFEQVAYLLWHGGELPTDAELAQFTQRERASRRIDRSLQSLLAKLPDTCHPMDVVRTAISYLGAEDPRGRRCLRIGELREIPSDVRGAAHDRRRRYAPPARPGSDRTAQSSQLLTELSADGAGGGSARQGDRGGLRAVHGALRRAQLQRVDLRGPRRHLDAVRYLQRRDRGHRCSQGFPARRCERGRHARHARNRLSRAGFGVVTRQAVPQREGDGVRAPGLPQR